MKSNFVPLEGWWSISINKLFKFPIVKKKQDKRKKETKQKKQQQQQQKAEKKGKEGQVVGIYLC